VAARGPAEFRAERFEGLLASRIALIAFEPSGDSRTTIGEPLP